MRPVRKAGLAAAVALAIIAASTGCGGEEVSHEVEEGVPLELKDLEFNVQLTRFLNPTDSQDSEYLADQQVPPPPGESYLSVSMTIENTSDEDVSLPSQSQVSVLDTTGAAYEALPSETDFAVPLGSTLAGGAEIPEPSTAAESGPTQGAIVIFLVGQDVPENRPLELEIEHEGETGTVTLDI